MSAVNDYVISKIIEPSSYIQLYLLNIKDNIGHINKSVIPENQIRELQKYRLQYDMDKRLLSRSFLYEFLYKKYNISDYEIGYNKFRRPFLKNTPRIHFSFSYAKEYTLIGISDKKRIGIDIEYIDSKPDVVKLASMICCKEELEKMYSLGNKAENQRIYFFQLFSAKESIIKAFGRGLHYKVKKLNTEGIHEFLYYNKKYKYQPVEIWQDNYTIAVCYEL